MKKCVSMLLVAVMAVSAGIILLPTRVKSQSFNLSLPVPFPPRIANVKIRQTGSPCTGVWITNTMGTQLNSGIDPACGAVEVRANIITNAPMKQDGSRGDIPLLITSGVDKPKLHYSTNFASGNPPTWTTVDATTIEGPVTNNTLHTNTYTVYFEIPASAIVHNQVVTYYIEARDNFNDANAKIGRSLVMNTKTKAGGFTSAEWPLSWDDAGTSQRMNWAGETPGVTQDGGAPPNETKTFADPQANPPIVSQQINKDLNIRQYWVGASNTELYVKLKVEGSINKGSNDLSAANAYVVAVLNRARPNKGGSTEDMVKGTFALAWFENADQTAGAFPGNPWLVDLEKSLAEGAVRPTTLPSGFSAYKSGNELHFKAPLSAFNVTPISSDPYYDPQCLVIAVGGAVIDARNMSDIKFVIHDISNGVSLYRKNYSFRPVAGSTPPATTFTLSGEVRNAVTNALVPACTGCIKIIDASTGMQVGSALNVSSSGTYSVALDPGNYIIRAEIPGTLVNEIPVDASEQGAGTTLTRNIRQYTTQQGGDISGDNIVDKSDLNTLVSRYKQPASNCPACDLNADGTINLKDFGILLRNLCKCPPTLAPCASACTAPPCPTNCCPLPGDIRCK